MLNPVKVSNVPTTSLFFSMMARMWLVVLRLSSAQN